MVNLSENREQRKSKQGEIRINKQEKIKISDGWFQSLV